MDFVQQKEGNSFGILGLHLWLHTSSMDRKSEKQDSNKGMKFSTLENGKAYYSNLSVCLDFGNQLFQYFANWLGDKKEFFLDAKSRLLPFQM